MNKEEITEKAQELTIKNVTDGKNKYFSWGFYKGCVVGLEYNNRQITELEKRNAELKLRICMSIECSEAQKNGELCLGYSGDEDEPCERCKNCIKCEGGYYQLGETEKDEQLTKAKEILENIIKFQPYIDRDAMFLTKGNDWKEVIFKAEQFIKDSEVKK